MARHRTLVALGGLCAFTIGGLPFVVLFALPGPRFTGGCVGMSPAACPQDVTGDHGPFAHTD